MTYYFRKSHVPSKCPVCGSVQPLPSCESGSNVFASFMTGWQVERVKKHPMWRFQCYWAYCMDCIFLEELMRKDYLLKNVPKDNWQGATISIPFGSKK